MGLCVSGEHLLFPGTSGSIGSQGWPACCFMALLWVVGVERREGKTQEEWACDSSECGQSVGSLGRGYCCTVGTKGVVHKLPWGTEVEVTGSGAPGMHMVLARGSCCES